MTEAGAANRRQHARAGVQVGLVAALLIVLAAVPGAARAASVTIDFEGISAGTVTNEYASQGIEFGRSSIPFNNDPGPILDSPPAAHSGVNAASITSCGEAACQHRTSALFSGPHRQVSVFARAYGSPEIARLFAYDAAGNLVGSDEKPAGTADWVELSIALPPGSADIFSFRVVRGGGGGAVCGCGLHIDDVSFDTADPGTPMVPDFAIGIFTLGAFYETSVPIPSGKSATAELSVARYNGAAGQLHYSASNLPPGVTAGFAPASPNSADRIVVRFTAAPGTSVNLANVLVTADPKGNASAGNEPRSVVVPIRVFGRYDLRIAGMDITQAIQTGTQQLSQTPQPGKPGAQIGYSGVPLVEGKKTVARVFAHTAGGGEVPGVTVALRGFDALTGEELAHSPITAIGGASTLTQGFPDGTSTNGTRFFVLPDEWTHRAQVRLRAEILPPAKSVVQFTGGELEAGECELAECVANNRFTVTAIPFRTVPYLFVRALELTAPGLRVHSPRTVFEATQAATPGTFSFGGGWHGGYDATIDINDIATDGPVVTEHASDKEVDLADARNTLLLARVQEWRDNASDNILLGTGAIIGVNASQAVARGVAEGGGDISDVDDVFGEVPAAIVAADRPLTSVAHEFGHLLGRPHASACTSGSDPGEVEGWPPDERGFIQGVGLDPRAGTGAAGYPYRLLIPAEEAPLFDFMSYCASIDGDPDSWISVPGWIRTMNFIRAHFGLSSAKAQASTAAAGPSAVRRVYGVVYANGNAGILSTSLSTKPLAAAQDSGLTLVGRTAAGEVTATAPARTLSGHINRGAKFTLFAGDLPVSEVRSVEASFAGVTLDARRASGQPPQVTLLGPKRKRLRGRAVRVRFRVADPDQDRLVAHVEYAADGSHYGRLVTRPARAGVNSLRLPLRALSRSRRGRLRVVVSDGFDEAAAPSRRLVVPGTPPRVELTGVPRRLTVHADDPIHLSGQAYDDRGVAIGARRLRWLRGRRVLGRGRAITVTGLPAGRHRLRLEARDRSGRRSSRVVRVRVRAVAPQFLVLRGPARLKRSVRRLKLIVASTLPARLVVGKHRFRVSRKQRTVRLRVKRGKAPLRVRLSLRSGGRATRVTLHVPR